VRRLHNRNSLTSYDEIREDSTEEEGGYDNWSSNLIFLNLFIIINIGFRHARIKTDQNDLGHASGSL
jgi:hypothetical protein